MKLASGASLQLCTLVLWALGAAHAGVMKDCLSTGECYEDPNGPGGCHAGEVVANATTAEAEGHPLPWGNFCSPGPCSSDNYCPAGGQCSITVNGKPHCVKTCVPAIMYSCDEGPNAAACQTFDSSNIWSGYCTFPLNTMSDSQPKEEEPHLIQAFRAPALPVSPVSPSGPTADRPVVTVTMFSDAQCPCSAQFVSDVKHILDGPASAFGASTTDFRQYFVPKCMDAFDTCKPPLATADLRCIHGAGECVGHRYFLCAMQQSDGLQSDVRNSSSSFPSYRESQRWLDFQQCAYGPCQLCDVFTELLCLTPCATYLNFTDVAHNRIMRDCAARVGLDWHELQACAATGAAEGDALQHASAGVCRARNATYGTKGLPVVTLTLSGPAGTAAPVRVETKQAIPLFCGPTPLELLRALCAVLPAGAAPSECASTRSLCGLVQNATRLPECAAGV